MKVYALVGPSGTGKSHRAEMVAHKYNISLIIDDGLLIRDGKILAGRSAKREETKMAAIRTALLYNQDQVNDIKKGIKISGEDKILILGTSKKMVEQIIKVLELPVISKLIRINSIASEEEMRKAQEVRKKEGKHVIPVPIIEVKSQFPGYFINPLELFFNNDDKPIKKEKTIVRPKFSYYGNLIIYNNVIIELIQQFIKKKDKIKSVKKIKVNKNKIGLKLSFNIILQYGIKIPVFVNRLMFSLKEYIEDFTGLKVLSFSIKIESLYLENK